jgi:hypothetical protein
MVLTKAELLDALQKEVRILVHLAGKVDPATADYRPTPKQRSTLELLRYLTNMGPELLKAAKTGGFDVPSWQAAIKAAEARDFAQTVAVLKNQGDQYAQLLGDMSDADFRAEMTGFDGKPVSKGKFIVDLVLAGHAAYRTQLFLYLKSNGRDELSTYNLWQGIDAPAPAAPAAT